MIDNTPKPANLAEHATFRFVTDTRMPDDRVAIVNETTGDVTWLLLDRRSRRPRLRFIQDAIADWRSAWRLCFRRLTP
jgi:hypothetical protein